MYKVNVNMLRMKMAEVGIVTAVELVKRTGLSMTAVCQVLHGSSNPGLYTMQKIAEALNMAPEEAGKIFFAKCVA